MIIYTHTSTKTQRPRTIATNLMKRVITNSVQILIKISIKTLFIPFLEFSVTVKTIYEKPFIHFSRFLTHQENV